MRTRATALLRRPTPHVYTGRALGSVVSVTSVRVALTVSVIRDLNGQISTLRIARITRISNRQLQILRPLGGVRVGRALVDLQLAEHVPAELVLREHALHRELDHALGV